MSTNPFGEAPPSKPERTIRPHPTNPFGPATKQPSHDISKGLKNPFTPSKSDTISTPPALAPVVPVQAPVARVVPSVRPSDLPVVPPTVPVQLPPTTPTTAPPLPLPLPPSSMPPAEIEQLAVPSTPVHSAPPPPLPAVAPQVSSDFHHQSDGFNFDAPVGSCNDPFGSVPVISDAVPTQDHQFHDDDFAVSFAASQAPPPPTDHGDFANLSSVSSHATPTPAPVPAPVTVLPVVVPEPEPNVHVLAAPPPQIDDDPYDMHVNKPLPVPVTAPAANPRAVRREDTLVKKPHKEGDPFSELVEPLKPKQVTNPFGNKPVNPLDSLPLNALMAKQQQQPQPVQPASSTATFAGYKFEIPVIPKVPVGASAKPPTQPTVAPASNDFGLLEKPVAAAPTAPSPTVPVVPSTAPAALVAISSSDLDIFAVKPKPITVSVAPPAAAPFDPFEPSTAPTTTATTITEDDTFDVFGLPKPNAATTKPGKTVAPPPPAINKIAANATRPSSKSTHIAPLETSHPLDHAAVAKLNASKGDSTTAHVTMNAEPDLIFSPAEHRKSKSRSFDHAIDDPFGVPVPPSTNNRSAPHSDDEDDIFGIGTSATSHSHHGNPSHHSDDPLARLKQSYGLTSNHEHDHTSDTFDDFDDFAFDQANHGRPANPASSTSSSSSAVRTAGGAASRVSKQVSSITDPAVEEGVQAEGDILSRLSTKAMLTKDWHETYYVIRRDNLYVFRQRGDYHMFLAQLMNRRERRGSADDNQPPLYKKCFPLVYNIKLEPIKAKEYKGLGTVYNFSLEQLEDFGLFHLGKFGSTDRESVQRLWDRIRVIVMEKRKEKVSPQPRYG